MLDLQVKDDQTEGYGKKPRRKRSKLERLRAQIVAHMREQRKAILRWTKQQTTLPWAFPNWDHFKLGALKMSQRMTPIISAIWDAAGTHFATRVGLDPNQWSVTNPFTAHNIEKASLSFCAETNKSTSTDLQSALDRLREQLHEGIVNEGESVGQLTKRVQAVFDTATKSRARTIAQTETSRAVHAAQEDAAHKSGVVTGWRWLLSDDACPVCVAIAARNPVVAIGQPFAVIGKNPQYSHVYHPPAHPNCNCTMTAVLDDEQQPEFSHNILVDPVAEDHEREAIREQLRQRDEAILRGSEAWGAAPYAERYPAKPAGARKPAKQPPPPKLPKRKPRVRTPEELFPGQYGPVEPGGEAIPARPKSFDEAQHPRDEHGRWASTGAGHQFGPSHANVMTARGTDPTLVSHNLGMMFVPSKEPTLQQLAGIVGATDDAHVIVGASIDEKLHILTMHGKYHTDRTIKVGKDLKPYIVANKFDVNASERGKGIYGPQVFGRMVENAIKHGCSKIVTEASRSPNESGYYTWARFGYDAPLSGAEKHKLPATLKGAMNVSDLMETPEGQQWWRVNGDTKKMKFDLTEGSKSLRIWRAYLEEKAKSQTSPMKTWKLQIELGRRSQMRSIA